MKGKNRLNCMKGKNRLTFICEINRYLGITIYLDTLNFVGHGTISGMIP
jgi:hypothetical protein